jgi:hypothetical protein
MLAPIQCSEFESFKCLVFIAQNAGHNLPLNRHLTHCCWNIKCPVFYQVISTYVAVMLVTVVTFTLTLFEVFKEIEHYFRNSLSNLQGGWWKRKILEPQDEVQ